MTGRLLASRAAIGDLRSRLAPFRRTIGTTGGLVLSTVLTSGTGFVFWWLAARQFPSSAVGLAGAAVSAMLLLSQISVMGLGTAMAGVLHREQRAGSMAVTALVAAGSTGLATGLVFALIAPIISDELAPISASPLLIALFAVGVGVTAFSAVLDQALVSVYRGSMQVLRNFLFSFGRLGLLALAAALLATGMSIYGAWTVATIGSILVIGLIPRHLHQLGHVLPLEWARLSGMAFAALSHHLLNLTRSSSVWLLPILVTALLSRDANAAFYVALLLANFVSVVGASATFTLYVVGARAPDQLWHQIRFTMGLTGAFAIGATLVLVVAGRTILGLFGASYADEAYPTVVVLAASTLPLAVKDHWIAIQRVRGGVGRAAAIGVGTLALELVAAALGLAVAGLVGLAVARFAVITGQAALMAPTVIRSMSRPRKGTETPESRPTERSDG